VARPFRRTLRWWSFAGGERRGTLFEPISLFVQADRIATEFLGDIAPLNGICQPTRAFGLLSAMPRLI
jgi:hypothetical protein